jgi:hypothetical protein
MSDGDDSELTMNTRFDGVAVLIWIAATFGLRRPLFITFLFLQTGNHAYVGSRLRTLQSLRLTRGNKMYKRRYG